MGKPSDIEARVSALETRIEEVAADATAARHLAAAQDRDLADLGVKVDANRKAINGLGVQTAERFDRLESEMRAGFARVDEKFARVDETFARVDEKFEQVDRGFAEMRGRFDQTAAGQQLIVELLTGLIERDAG